MTGIYSPMFFAIGIKIEIFGNKHVFTTDQMIANTGHEEMSNRQSMIICHQVPTLKLCWPVSQCITRSGKHFAGQLEYYRNTTGPAVPVVGHNQTQIGWLPEKKDHGDISLFPLHLLVIPITRLTPRRLFRVSFLIRVTDTYTDTYTVPQKVHGVKCKASKLQRIPTASRNWFPALGVWLHAEFHHAPVWALGSGFCI